MITASLVIYHNPRQEIESLLGSVLRSPIARLYIIDNSRNDIYRALTLRSRRIHYIHNANDGYGAAHNIALREAIRLGAKYHVVLNPDITFGDGVIEALAEYTSTHKRVGWIMPKIVYPNGDVQHLCKLLPTPFDLIARRFIPKRFLSKYRERFNPKIENREVVMPYLSGCFIFLRVSALRRVGLFDERFFMYGEDLDLSRRMYARYKTVYYPKVTVTHAHRAESYHSRKMLKVHIQNIIRYFNKWGWFFDSERKQINREIAQQLSLKNR
ncbi:MAG: glycosyltransferase family 2 protein [Alistipes sp.]|nr:glycosyltransferase family 2 protein [Alistipes sp.]